jgi:hypothetical protein
VYSGATQCPAHTADTLLCVPIVCHSSDIRLQIILAQEGIHTRSMLAFSTRAFDFLSCPVPNFHPSVRGQSPSPLTGMFFFGLYLHVRLGVRGGNYVCLFVPHNYLNNVLDII